MKARVNKTAHVTSYCKWFQRRLGLLACIGFLVLCQGYKNKPKTGDFDQSALLHSSGPIIKIEKDKNKNRKTENLALHQGCAVI